MIESLNFRKYRNSSLNSKEGVIANFIVFSHPLLLISPLSIFIVLPGNIYFEENAHLLERLYFTF